MERKVEKSLRAKTTLTKWRGTRTKIANFLKTEYKVEDIALDKFAYAFAEDFVDFLMLEQGLGIPHCYQRPKTKLPG